MYKFVFAAKVYTSEIIAKDYDTAVETANLIFDQIGGKSWEMMEHEVFDLGD